MLMYRMAALCSIVLRYAGARIATRVSFFFFLLFVWRCRFFECFLYAGFSLYGEYAVRSFLPDGVFLSCDYGLGFLTSAYCVRIQTYKTV